jgi:A/G-specific adenine glycosylase
MFVFSDALLEWFDVHGRHDLPWQVADDPYKVWVSEIMLQQTQVKTVLQYFERFIQRFPTVQDLGTASWDEVAPYWAGLGYYARARNLHKAAGIVASQGHFPTSLEEWIALPGIGRSTAGALMSLGLRQYGVIMDGNVKRVLARFFAIEDDLSKPVHERALWELAEQLCPVERNHDYTQAIMDLGATVCTPKKPLCLYCPMQQHCKAHQQGLENELPFKKPKSRYRSKQLKCC